MQAVIDIAKDAATNEGSFPADGIYDELVATPKAYPALVPYQRRFPQMEKHNYLRYKGDIEGRVALIDRTGNRTWTEMETLLKAWAHEAAKLDPQFTLTAVLGYETKLGGKNVRVLEVSMAMYHEYDLDG